MSAADQTPDLAELLRAAATIDAAILSETPSAKVFELGAELGGIAVVLLGRMASRGALEFEVSSENAARSVGLATALGAWADSHPTEGLASNPRWKVYVFFPPE